jgi:hypothetical protein
MFIIFYSFPTFHFRMTCPSLGATYHLLKDPITTTGGLHRRHHQNLQASMRLPHVFRNFGKTVYSRKSYFVVSLERPQPTWPTCPSSHQVLLFLTYSLAYKPPLSANKIVLHVSTPHWHACIDPLMTRLVLITTVAAQAHCCKIQR